jgi:NitT/TauT family transport system permease protein
LKPVDVDVETRGELPDVLESMSGSGRWDRLRSVGWVQPMAGLIGVIVIWALAVQLLSIPQYLIPSPWAVVQSMVERRETLLINFIPTAIETVLGFLIGNVIGVGMAVLFVHWNGVRRTFFPLAVVAKTIPIVAIVPVLVLMLGYGYAPKIAIAALITFFPTLINMVIGLQAVDRQALELFRVYSATGSEEYRKLRFHASLPYFFAALEIAAPTAVIGSIVAEWIGAEKGLGFLIIQATHNYRTPLLYATMVVSSLFALSLLAIIASVRRRVVRWDTEASTH